MILYWWQRSHRKGGIGGTGGCHPVGDNAQWLLYVAGFRKTWSVLGRTKGASSCRRQRKVMQHTWTAKCWALVNITQCVLLMCVQLHISHANCAFHKNGSHPVRRVCLWQKLIVRVRDFLGTEGILLSLRVIEVAYIDLLLRAANGYLTIPALNLLCWNTVLCTFL